MRILVYNIRYGTGGGRRLFPWGGYMGRTHRTLANLSSFVGDLQPDIVGLLEVDAGSYRSRRLNQAEIIARELGHYHTYSSKYAANSIIQRFPVANRQGNAFLSRDTIENEHFHFFTKGAKRLVIELELAGVVIFLVHLSLRLHVRHHQLNDLYTLVRRTKKPHIVAGDFNALWGDHEIELFLAAAGLTSANTENRPSFPSGKPRRQLDFILYSPGIVSERFWMPDVTYSDHLPLVWDFHLSGRAETPDSNPVERAEIC